MLNENIVDARQIYYEFLDNVNSIKDSLLENIETLEKINNDMDSAYTVDEGKADEGYLVKTLDEAKRVYNSLVYTIIPAINEKIDIMSSQM